MFELGFLAFFGYVVILGFKWSIEDAKPVKVPSKVYYVS